MDISTLIFIQDYIRYRMDNTDNPIIMEELTHLDNIIQDNIETTFNSMYNYYKERYDD